MNCSEQALGFSSLKVAKRETNQENVEYKVHKTSYESHFIRELLQSLIKSKRGLLNTFESVVKTTSVIDSNALQYINYIMSNTMSKAVHLSVMKLIFIDQTF